MFIIFFFINAGHRREVCEGNKTSVGGLGTEENGWKLACSQGLGHSGYFSKWRVGLSTDSIKSSRAILDRESILFFKTDGNKYRLHKIVVDWCKRHR